MNETYLETYAAFEGYACLKHSIESQIDSLEAVFQKMRIIMKLIMDEKQAYEEYTHI